MKKFRLFSKRKMFLIMLALSFAPAKVFPSEVDDESNRRSSTQVFAAVASWREESLLVHSDGREFKLNTLNTVGRLGVVNYFSKGRFFTRYGLVIGQSENASAVTSLAYFQRSVLLAGAEAALGATFFHSPGVEMNLSLGGVFRSINHTLPNGDYTIPTKARFIPLATFEYLWRLTNALYWRQFIGTQGKAGDTWWSAGLGLDW